LWLLGWAWLTLTIQDAAGSDRVGLFVGRQPVAALSGWRARVAFSGPIRGPNQTERVSSLLILRRGRVHSTQDENPAPPPDLSFARPV
jgi:hypothetical protein